jgi:uncharacterized LabA/DUF88 family protein
MSGNSPLKIAIYVDVMNVMGMSKYLEKNINFRALLNFLIKKVLPEGEIIIKDVFYDIYPNGNSQRIQEFINPLIEKLNFKSIGAKVKVYSTASSQERAKTFKSRTDQQLTVNVMEHLYQEKFDVIVLLAGDSDYEFLLEKCLEKGKKVIIVSAKKALAPELNSKYVSTQVILLDDYPYLLTK